MAIQDRPVLGDTAHNWGTNLYIVAVYAIVKKLHTGPVYDTFWNGKHISGLKSKRCAYILESRQLYIGRFIPML